MTDKKAKDTQIGGDHYKDMKIEPITFFAQNQTPFPEANTCKYVLRHRYKNGLQDLKKARHMIDLMIEEYYPEEVEELAAGSSDHPASKAVAEILSKEPLRKPINPLNTTHAGPAKFGGDPIDHGEKEFMDTEQAREFMEVRRERAKEFAFNCLVLDYPDVAKRPSIRGYKQILESKRLTGAMTEEEPTVESILQAIEVGFDPEDHGEKEFMDATTEPKLDRVSEFHQKIVDKVCADMNSERKTNQDLSGFTVGGLMYWDEEKRCLVSRPVTAEEFYKPSEI